MTGKPKCGPPSNRTQWLSRYTALAFTGALLTWSGLVSADLSVDEYDPLFKQYGDQFIPEYQWTWLKAQSYQESRFNPAAVSPVGATGLMQIMPGTGAEIAKATGVRGPLTSPTISVFYGAFYMRRMLNIWSSPRLPLARLDLAFASYNAGAGHIIKAQQLSGGHLLWCGISPHLHQVTGRHSLETLTYVERIHRWKGQIDATVHAGSSDLVGQPGED